MSQTRQLKEFDLHVKVLLWLEQRSWLGNLAMACCEMHPTRIKVKDGEQMRK